MGLGMFSLIDLCVGDLILCERPLMITTKIMPSESEVAQHRSNANLEERRRAYFDQYEKCLEIAFERLKPENKAAFLALHNSHRDDGCGPVFGIIRTNQFGVTLVSGEEGRLPRYPAAEVHN